MRWDTGIDLEIDLVAAEHGLPEGGGVRKARESGGDEQCCYQEEVVGFHMVLYLDYINHL